MGQSNWGDQFSLTALCLANLVAVDHGYGRPIHSLSASDARTVMQVSDLTHIRVISATPTFATILSTSNS